MQKNEQILNMAGRIWTETKYYTIQNDGCAIKWLEIGYKYKNIELQLKKIVYRLKLMNINKRSHNSNEERKYKYEKKIEYKPPLYNTNIVSRVFVRLSLLTMTNPNQMREVLLFVWSKMADETNLSSKLLVADRPRAIWGRKLCWWWLSAGFPMPAFLLGFADSFCFVFTSTLSYEASLLFSILCNLFPRLCWYFEVLNRCFECVLVSLLLTTMRAFSTYRIFFGKRSSGILVTWPVHLNCVNYRIYILHPCSFQDSCLATSALEYF